MKRQLLALALLVASSIAFALPAPKDIEAAVKAGQLDRAEQMLQEVIRAKPDSAKARYELGQVLARAGRKIEARDALIEAQRLDPALKFAHDPAQFQDLLRKLQGPGLSSAPVEFKPQAASVMAQASAPAAPAPTFPWGYVLLGGGALAAVWFFARRMTPPAAGLGVAGAMAGGNAAAYSPGNVAGVNPGNAAGYGVPQQRPGMGIGGAVLGGVAGLAAGYGLAKAFEHGDSSSHAATSGNSGLVPFEPAAQADYGNFDAGNGDSWEANDAGDAGSDGDSW